MEKNQKIAEKGFDSIPFYGDDEKYIKTKIKTYGNSVINFHNKKYQKKKHHLNFYQ